MKKIITLLTLFLLLPVASASDSIDITDKSEIKYKWYKIEKEDGIYYEKGKNLEGYIEDKNNYKVSYNYTLWSQSNCYDSRENFVIESKQTYIYESVIKIKYILLEDIEEKDIKEISIYSGNKKIEHKIISTSDKKIKIDLQSLYYVDDLWMYIDSTKPYKILTSPNESFALLALSKNVENTKILLPDKTWITNKTVYNTEYNDAFRHKTDFIKSIRSETNCRKAKIYTYRYKIKKIYYDDNYYKFIPNYIKDESDYIIEYTSKIPTKTITITNTKKEQIIKKEYIYNEAIKEVIKKEEKQNTAPINNTKYIETQTIKKVTKVPKRVYLLIIFQTIIIILETILVCKKSRTKHLSSFVEWIPKNNNLC